MSSTVIIKRVWKHMQLRKCWHNFHFWVKCFFSSPRCWTLCNTIYCSPLWWQKHLVSNEVNRTLLKIVFFSFPSGCCWSCWYIPYTLGLSASLSFFVFSFHFPIPSCLNVDGFWKALCVPYLWFCGVLLYRLVMSKV